LIFSSYNLIKEWFNLDKKPLNKLLVVILVFFSIIIISLIGFVIWAQTPLGPMDEAIVAMESDSRVKVMVSTWIEFKPEDIHPVTGLIFYPGGRVDPRSYAPLARSIAEEGYLVVIAPMPFNLAVFSPNRASQVIRAFPEIETWAVGGHSLGGAMAANFTESHPELVSGLVLWASYPPGSTDLSEFNLEVVSIYGSNDYVLSAEGLESSRDLLPKITDWVLIEGGNHAQFGWYGIQPGDGKAEISRIEQQAQILTATAKLLASIQKKAGKVIDLFRSMALSFQANSGILVYQNT
jgi:hypothetical protein